MKKFYGCLAVFLILSLLVGMTGIVTVLATRQDTTDEKSYAAVSLKTAAEAVAAGATLDWSQYDWKAEYLTSNISDWTPMVIANADVRSFSHNGTHGAQPCVQVKQKESISTEPYKVNLNANQWGSASWWSKAAVTYTAKEAGKYTLTCDTMEPGRLWSSSAGGFIDTLNGTNGDGHVTVYKNDVQIWPATGYASVTSDNHPVFEPMTVELAVGDTIRFEGFGGEIGKADATANPNSYLNDIFINPAIEKKGEDESSATSSSATTASSVTTSTTRQPSTTVDPEKQNLKVLFIGNSATEVNSMPNMFKKMAEKAGYTLTVDQITWGGCTLTRYADPDDEAGKAAYSKLENGNDIVFLQENSACIASDASRQASKDACDTLDEIIRAKGGKTYLYVRPSVNHSNFGYTPKQQAEEFTKLFDEISRKLAAPAAPAARAFAYVREKYPDISLYMSDEEHPNKTGSYLIACICFATLYDHSPVGIYDAGLSADVADKLQRAAEYVVFGTENSTPSSGSGAGTTAPNSGALASGTYSAHDSLMNSLKAGDVLLDELWHPVYTDKARPNWEIMQAGEETFSFKSTDWALPYVWPATNGGVVLNANQWADGKGWWDKSGITFTAPADQEVILKSGNIKTISAAAADQLTSTEGRVAIYLNGNKIWPTDAEYMTVSQNKSVDFPEIPLSLKKGDVVVIEGYGAVPDGAITDNVNGSWANQILMDPVIDVPKDDPGESNSSTTANSTVTTQAVVEDVVISANKVLLKDLAAGNVQMDSVWKPVYTDANSVVDTRPLWKEMVANAETFSMKNTDYALPYVYPIPDGGLVMNANQWAGNGFWDKAGIAYTAPSAQKVVLRAGKIKTISPAADFDAENCSKNEGRVAIYLNDKKIWPADADYVALKKGESVDFPELELTLNKGDVILIEAYGAKPGGAIGDENGNDWRNAVLLDPEVFVLAPENGGQDSPSTGASAIPAVAALLVACGTAGITLVSRKRR